MSIYRMRVRLSTVLALLLLTSCGESEPTALTDAEDDLPLPPVSTLPPFGGTIFIDPDIITSSDPTTFQNLSFAGQGSRTMFDRRVNDWITVDAYLFNASSTTGWLPRFR